MAEVSRRKMLGNAELYGAETRTAPACAGGVNAAAVTSPAGQAGRGTASRTMAEEEPGQQEWTLEMAAVGMTMSAMFISAGEPTIPQRAAQTAAGAHDRAISSVNAIPSRRRISRSDYHSLSRRPWDVGRGGRDRVPG